MSIGLSWPTHPSRFHVSQQHYAGGLNINVGFEGDNLIPTTAHSDHGLHKEWKVLQAGEMLWGGRGGTYRLVEPSHSLSQHFHRHPDDPAFREFITCGGGGKGLEGDRTIPENSMSRC